MNVKIKRIMLGFSQKDLASLIGVSNVTIGKIEKGQIDNIRFGTLKKLAAALNSTVEELFLKEE
ncbi:MULTISPECIES: helix-turn-helix transcriptional regulator [Clostridium]|uniref:helix-turn-helix transcriptional regulator n=1 Tax=Clostridium TaxID=1485 RepID=UPI00189BB156|nr:MULTISPECIES: helix-turn-helix transcriptional regulator [Clostridium]MDB2123844.1 helix-turn-helix transcriptional regulator [Clostridium paraputrificum]MDU6875395.1 helix-turn-helix transcriptional regulator [Clostridium sp.]MDU6936483.1 helix-turn-helix transcriptional regulator [Clostridium sp.]